MSYQKNEEVVLTIEDISDSGEGIGKAEGYTVFVKDAVIGDVIRARIIKAKKNYGFGRLLEVLEPSSDRVTPLCPVARQCGGCHLQAISYKKQLEFKENKVRNHLKRIGGFEEINMEPIISMDIPWHYRNKAQFPIGRGKDGHIIAGFYAGRTHMIMENLDCALGIPVNKEILEMVIGHMETYGIQPYREENGSGLVRHVLIRSGYHTGQLMVCLVLNGRKLPEEHILVEKLSAVPGMTSIMINVNKAQTNVILGKELRLLWGTPYIIDYIGDAAFQISPLSFFQVNPVQTEKLYRKALEYADLTGNEIVWDLYCGIGTISLFLAQKAARVYGVEIIPAAVENARENAKRNHIENAVFFEGKAEEILPGEYREHQIHADVIVVDPPRKGCDVQLLDTMLKMQPARIVYVSCDSATLARDLKYLCEGGYEQKKICPVDHFPQTVHVETVCLLSNTQSKKKESYMTLDVEMADYYRIKNEGKNSTT